MPDLRPGDDCLYAGRLSSRRRQPFRIRLENVGDGEDAAAWFEGAVTEDAMAAVGDEASSWLIKSVERRSNSHPNDGGKLRALATEELLYDRRYVLD